MKARMPWVMVVTRARTSEGGGVGGGYRGEQGMGFTGRDEELASFHRRIEEPALVVGEDGVGDEVLQSSEGVFIYPVDWIMRAKWFIRRDWMGGIQGERVLELDAERREDVRRCSGLNEW